MLLEISLREPRLITYHRVGYKLYHARLERDTDGLGMTEWLWGISSGLL